MLKDIRGKQGRQKPLRELRWGSGQALLLGAFFSVLLLPGGEPWGQARSVSN